MVLDQIGRIIYECNIAAGVIIRPFTVLHGCSVGKEAIINAFVEIQEGVEIGYNSVIETHTFICRDTIIGNYCYIGNNVTFKNDIYPRNQKPDSRLFIKEKETIKTIPILIENRVLIGSGSVILSGVVIEEGAIIGANSVVNSTVPAGEIWIGNPATFFRKVNLS